VLDIHVTILPIEKVDQLASSIRQVGDRIASKMMTHPAYSSRESWEKRDWIPVLPSPQERFLSSFPVLNSFHAQIILSQMTLSEAMGLTLDELLNAFGLWIPERNLKIFYMIIHSPLIE
jgi:hypothetical protein